MAYSIEGLVAAGYVRVSTKLQDLGHSPETQRSALTTLAKQEKCTLGMMEEDSESGLSITRNGYQRIMQAVREGRVHVVLVFCFDRWGRDGVEWLTRAQELDRLGIPIISVQEGRDEAGPMRYVRVMMHEWFSRQLAAKVRPNREAAARTGTHMGSTPYGYHRVYPPFDGKRRPAGALVEDPVTAPIVRDLFSKYAEGGWSLRGLTFYLNSQGIPTMKDRRWSAITVAVILRNVVYVGKVRYNIEHSGRFERASDADRFITEGKHAPLVSQELFDQVQQRLDAAKLSACANRHLTASGRPIATLATLLRCPECGSMMSTNWSRERGMNGYYCNATVNGITRCSHSFIGYELANQAVLTQVKRLLGVPWTTAGESRVLGADADVVRVSQLQKALAAEQGKLKRNTYMMSELIDDPTPEQIQMFRTVSGEISARIAVLEKELNGWAEKAHRLPDLKRLHRQLSQSPLSAVIDRLVALGTTGALIELHELLCTLLTSALIVDRRPEFRPRWVRAEVTWSEDITTLLGAGELVLAPLLTEVTALRA